MRTTWSIRRWKEEELVNVEWYGISDRPGNGARSGHDNLETVGEGFDIGAKNIFDFKEL